MGWMGWMDMYVPVGKFIHIFTSINVFWKSATCVTRQVKSNWLCVTHTHTRTPVHTKMRPLHEHSICRTCVVRMWMWMWYDKMNSQHQKRNKRKITMESDATENEPLQCDKCIRCRCDEKCERKENPTICHPVNEVSSICDTHTNERTNLRHSSAISSCESGRNWFLMIHIMSD